MRHLKEYKLWEQSRGLTPEQEEFLNQYVRGTWRINSEGLVDVEGDFDCSGSGIIKSLQGIRFGSVTVDFYCHENQLTSLEGAPLKVGGNFGCHRNKLTSLVGAPLKVGDDFYCHENQLTSLEGAPLKVGGDFDCQGNPISGKTMELIYQKMMENPKLEYGAILVALQSKIPVEEWDKLDKRSIDRMEGKRRKGFKLLGALGGI